MPRSMAVSCPPEAWAIVRLADVDAVEGLDVEEDALRKKGGLITYDALMWSAK